MLFCNVQSVLEVAYGLDFPALTALRRVLNNIRSVPLASSYRVACVRQVDPSGTTDSASEETNAQVYAEHNVSNHCSQSV